MRTKSGIAGFVLTVLMASSQVALAETMYLQCGQTKLTVDLTNNTVDNSPATINPTAIDWSVSWPPYPDGSTASGQFHIDRTAGTLTSVTTVCFGSGGYKGSCRQIPPSPPVACTKTSAPNTKF